MVAVATISRRTRTFLLVSIVGCHHAPPKANLRPNEGRLAGDTLAFRARLIDFNRARHRVTFQLNEAAHVVLLSVVPGKTVQPVGGLPAGTSALSPGRHAVIAIPNVEMVPSDPSTWTISQQADYDQCVARARASLPKKTVVRHDSTGREVTERTDQPQDPSREYAIERRCERTVARRPPTPDPSDRYLVLLASNTPLSVMDVATRIDAMEVSPNDVHSMISAIAEALYLEPRAVWSAHYVRW